MYVCIYIYVICIKLYVLHVCFKNQNITRDLKGNNQLLPKQRGLYCPRVASGSLVTLGENRRTIGDWSLEKHRSYPTGELLGVFIKGSLHPGRLTAGTYKSSIWKGTWPSKPPWLCSMLICRGVIISGDGSFVMGQLARMLIIKKQKKQQNTNRSPTRKLWIC